ncbi:MAG: porin family protein [Pseudomonadota bacterium]
MRKHFYARFIFCLVSAFLFAQPSFAASGKDQRGWFFGLSLERPEPAIALPNISFAAADDSNRKFSAGYRFGPHWQAELNYLDVAKPSLAFSFPSEAVSLETHGKGLQLLGTANMLVTDKIGLFGKVGAFHSNLESSCTTNILTCSGSDRSTDLSYGVGLRYDFTKTVSVRGEWDHFRRFGSHDVVGEPDRDFFSVGVGFKF